MEPNQPEKTEKKPHYIRFYYFKDSCISNKKYIIKSILYVVILTTKLSVNSKNNHINRARIAAAVVFIFFVLQIILSCLRNCILNIFLLFVQVFF